MEGKRTMTPTQAGQLLGENPQNIRQWVRTGGLRAIRLGRKGEKSRRRILIREGDLFAFLEEAGYTPEELAQVRAKADQLLAVESA